ncbi:MAG: ATP-dependent DNA helicase RecG [Ardenticatenaceae bacterium]|nr:ATP-dependent DNA helicase RecG [Ardenticatenaceae bacterium]
MSKSFQRLKNILKLEVHQGYQNKAVVGGLRQFISYWISQAREEAVDEADRAFVEQTAEALSDYGSLPGKNARLMLVNRLLDRLDAREERVATLTTTVEPGSIQITPAVKPDPAPVIKETVEPAEPADSTAAVDHEEEGDDRVVEAASKEITADEPVLEEENDDVKTVPDDHKSRKQSEPSANEKQMERPQRQHPDLAEPVLAVRGVGARMSELLSKLSISTVSELLYHFPHRYDDYTKMKPINQLKVGEQVTLIGTVWEVRARKSRSNQVVVQAVITDGSGKIQASWFNQPWLTKKLKSGHRIVLSGKVDQYLGRPVFNAPQWELLSMDGLRTGRIVPVYPLTQGLSNHKLRQILRSAVPYWSKKLADPLPEEIRERRRLLPLNQAITRIHLPESTDDLIDARRRIAFEELLLLQLGMFGQRQTWVSEPGRPLQGDGSLQRPFIQNLPFNLTSAQQRVVREISADLGHSQPMNRLLQGDVGSGKTVVAALAMLTAVEAGTQAVMMAPTEILAEQHARSLREMIAPLGLQVELLTGSLSAADKTAVKGRIASGQTPIAVGTHALIQGDVTFKNLGLAVIDEQHRFGVDQRKALREKGMVDSGETLTPHLMVMSATPIPRSLALSLYGDLDFSVLDEMPPGRQEIRTHWLRPHERERCYGFVRGQVEKGRQAYIICPLVEESDKVEAVAAVEEYERLSQEIFPDLRLGLVHGRLKAAEKEAVMRLFYEGDLDVLVATSVIEVGVDVPNSTVMVIEGANRFGLAQLHQFRGRVGRGEHQSFCLLVADDSSADAEQRLTALEDTNDGFQLAEKDLELRGPGEFFGRRQSGLPELRLASLTDMTLLQEAREEAEQLFADDPHLEKPEHSALHRRVIHFWKNAADVS